MTIRQIMNNPGIDEEFRIVGKLKRMRVSEELRFPWKIVSGYSDEDGKQYTIIANINTSKKSLIVSSYSEMLELDI